jgi:SAM-dependent methyltransferase
MTDSFDIMSLLKLALLSKPEGPCLDIGCGIGLTLGVLGKRTSAVGIDLSRSEITFARKRCAGLPVDFVVADAQNLPFKAETLCGAVCLHLLEHVPNPKKVVDDINRVLKPSSFLLVEIPNGFSLNEQVTSLIYKLRRRDIRRVHKHRFTEKSFSHLFSHSWSTKGKYRRGFIGVVPLTVISWLLFSLSSPQHDKVSAEFFSQSTNGLTGTSLLRKIMQSFDCFLSSKFPSKAVCFTYLYEKP